MLHFADDEHDKDRDEEEDADLDDENSEDEDSEDEDKDADSDSDDDSDSDKDDEEDEEEDEDNKPVTRKELRELLKGNQNKNSAHRRVTSKKDGRDTKQPSDTDKRLAQLEQSNKERMLLEKKLDFASEHGLSKKQVNYVFKLTNRPTPKFLNKPHVKAALDAIKSQEGVARNTPSSSGKRFKAPGGKKWTELSSEERQSNFQDRRASILANKR